MRTFIAINFDKTVKKYISGIKNVVKENSKSGNFTDEENYHLIVFSAQCAVDNRAVIRFGFFFFPFVGCGREGGQQAQG